MIDLDSLNDEELTKLFRDVFDRLSSLSQSRELARIDRIVHNRPVLLAIPLDEPDRAYKFQNIDHFVSWLHNNGCPNAHNSNVYKALKGSRSTAYGYSLKYKEEK